MKNGNEIVSNEDSKIGFDSVLCNVEFDKRIIETPYYHSWYNSTIQDGDSIREDGKINYDGLSDINKLCLYVYAWNKSEIYPSKGGILKKFGWTNYKLQKLLKQVNIFAEPTFDQNTGLISGRGYLFYGA